MKMVIMTSAAALLLAGAGEAGAQQRAGSGPRINIPSHSNHFSWDRGQGFHGGFGGVWIVEREPVIVEREVIREVAVPAAPPPPPPEPRKPFVVGQSYASLPGGCMKMIEGAASYYYCGGGEWYRPVGGKFQAIAKP